DVVRPRPVTLEGAVLERDAGPSLVLGSEEDLELAGVLGIGVEPPVAPHVPREHEAPGGVPHQHAAPVALRAVCGPLEPAPAAHRPPARGSMTAASAGLAAM